jgi:hypothetical protein
MPLASRLFVVVAVVMLVVAGCSADNGEAPSASPDLSGSPHQETSSPPPSPPVLDVPSEMPTVDPTPAPPEVYARGDHAGSFEHWDLPMNADGTAGSGCTPPTGSLPDGRWFGSIGTWTSTSITFTPRCLYHRDSTQYKDYNEQFAAGESRYITESSVGTRTLATVRNVPAWHAWSNGRATTLDLLFSEFEYAQETVWVFVNDGIVTEVVEDYSP